MSTLNPLKFVGGLVLEVGAVIAALAVLPGLGGWMGSDNYKLSNTSFANTPAEPIANQVYFDANSSRVMDDPAQRSSPPAAWQNDYAPAPPVSQQRYVENTLDHSSQRALDAAARLWNQGDRLLPPELRVRREATNDPVVDRSVEPLREYSPRGSLRSEPLPRETMSREPMPRDLLPRTADYRVPDNDVPTRQEVSAQPEYRRPSHYSQQPNIQPSYAPTPNYAPAPNYYAPRYSAQDQPRRTDERY